MASLADLHIFCACSPKVADVWRAKTGYQIHSIGKTGYWLNVGDAIRQASPSGAIVVSGVNDSRLLYPVFRSLAKKLSGPIQTCYLQGVSMNTAPGRLGASLLNTFDQVACTNRGLHERFRLRLRREPVLIQPGVELARIQSLAAAPKNRRLRIGFFNHLNMVKGADLALEAFACLPFDDTEYVVAGFGKLENELRRKYEGRGGIRFLGALEDPLAEIKACDLMVLPFRTSVSVLGVSQTVLECLAAGVPVIGTKHEAITAAIVHGRNGLILQPGEKLADVIRRVHDDPNLRRRLSDDGKESAKHYDIRRVALSLLSCVAASN
jgi:glycosyltransferase involved in cell wall biosynthesis